jgi:hypothetical protein
MLFPHRYILEKFQEGTPPDLPWTAHVIDPSYSLTGHAESVLLKTKSFVKEWATMKDSPGAPTANEMRVFACRYGMMQPMSVIRVLVAEIMIIFVDRAAGYDDLSALSGRLKKTAGAKISDAGRGARKYVQTSREMVALTHSVAFTENFLGDPYFLVRRSRHKPGEVNWDKFQQHERSWELRKGGYYEWAFCQDEIRPLLERLAAFDYDNPAAYSARGGRKPPPENASAK